MSAHRVGEAVLATGFTGSTRFQIFRRLGAGGAGVVYEALDRVEGVRVALKTLATVNAEALLRFKQEFRGLQALEHPNLVRLGELIEEDGHWLFTMELVDGVDLLSHVELRSEPSPDDRAYAATAVGRGTVAVEGAAPATTTSAPRFSEERLRSDLRQLARGLAYLHAAGKVHRDIKPQNVLVTPEGRVVLLDFGLLLDVGEGDRVTGADHVVGTPEFMAPEQAKGAAVGPEADWYAFGVILYRALTGRMPYLGSSDQVMQLKQVADPPAPSVVAAFVPGDLELLCLALMSRDPSKRPDGAEVLRQLGGRSDRRPLSLAGETPFVGRGAELRALSDAFDDAQRAGLMVQLCGDSGLGKSVVARRFADRLAAHDGALVLLGRCYERESVPYKAVDGVVDALTQHLAQLPRAEAALLVPPHAELLLQVFPVLRRVEALVEAEPVAPVADPQERRRLVNVALRQLFANVARRHRLVLLLEDLHWADQDSLRLVEQLLRPPAPPIFILGTARRPVAIDGEVRRLDLERLDDEEARALALRLLGAMPEREQVATAIARDAEGHPMFIAELARQALVDGAEARQPKLDEVLWSRVSRLDGESRDLIALLAVAGTPVQAETLARATALDPDGLGRRVTRLRVGHLVRSSGARRTDTLEIYHDRIREAVTERLEPAQRIALHRRLALALEAASTPDVEALAASWAGAGEAARAAAYALRAADAEAARFSFDRAARLYRLALDQNRSGQRRPLELKLADALANAGRGAEAAPHYLSALDGASAAEALDLRRRAGEQLLRSGRIDDGLAALGSVLADLQMPLARSPQAALVSLGLRRAQIRLRGRRFRARDASEVSQAELTRIDVCWSVAALLGLVDIIRGADFQTRNLLLALRAGEPYRVARALAVEASFCATGGARAERRTRRLCAETVELASRAGNPHALGLASFAAGIAEFQLGRFAEALPHFRACEALFRERCTGVAWEISNAELFTLWSLYYCGDLDEVERRLPQTLADAEARGDRYTATGLRTGLLNTAALAVDDVPRAERELAVARAAWSREGFHLQHYFDLIGQVQLRLYRGDGAGALAEIASRWRALERSLLLEVQLSRLEALHLYARAAVAEGSAASLRLAGKLARRILREQRPWADPMARLVLAAIAARKDRLGEAMGLLERAAGEADAAAVHLFALAARRRQGERRGGEAGARLIAEADEGFLRRRVRNPSAFTQMLAPGL